jgi:hypothetical protein
VAAMTIARLVRQYQMTRAQRRRLTENDRSREVR